MGNLGWYQVMVVAAKRVGGPLQLGALLVGGGAALGAAGLKAVQTVKEGFSNAIADKEKEAQRDADAAGDEESFEADLFDEDNNALIMNDEDYQGFRDSVEEDIDEDDEYFNSLLNNTEMI